MDFAPFKDTTIRGIKVENIEKPNSWYKAMEEYVKTLSGNLGYIKVNEDMTFKSSLDKFMTDEIRNELKERLSLEKGNVIFIIADKEKCAKLLGQLRIKLGEELELINKNKYEFCIVNNFPFYEKGEEGEVEFSHNPFSMPQGGLEALENQNPFDILAHQYDFVCNGYEMASGGVRNHRRDILKKAFAIAGYDEEVVKSKFPSLYEAFRFGAPPHAGMAPGIDRILMLLKDEENIREMVAFPLGANGADAMMGCPGEVFEKQLREAHIKIRD
jgi:aspartyl-tRNA synthetase